VIGLVVAQPGAHAVLVDDLGAHNRRIELDHLLEARRLQVEVVELRVDDSIWVAHFTAP
jgi:hypothetical protein